MVQNKHQYLSRLSYDICLWNNKSIRFEPCYLVLLLPLEKCRKAFSSAVMADGLFERDMGKNLMNRLRKRGARLKIYVENIDGEGGH